MAARDPDLYRPNVGMALFHENGLVLLARRIGAPPPFVWQMPQGGVDRGEDIQTAALRELEEEIGVTAKHVTLLEELNDWLYYDFPGGLREEGSKGRFRGQRQRWFAFRFHGTDADIRLDSHTPEFTEWRWARLDAAPSLIVPFKRAVYEEVARRFAKWATPSATPG
jgi:putative (di)nucleoside polyphosphate hydrolase